MTGANFGITSFALRRETVRRPLSCVKLTYHPVVTASLATARLQAIFQTMLLRRKKDSVLDGKRLIELPPKSINLHKLEFSPEEREIYAMSVYL
jgi:SNF2 family DNA or RNA helicase